MKRETIHRVTAVLALTALQVEAEEGAEKAHVDPAELVRAIIAAESKILGVDSFLLRIEGKWTRTPERIADARAELERKYPDFKITPERFPELRPEQKETLELAFDRSRLRHHHFEPDKSTSLRIWDGHQAWLYTRYFTHEQESYLLDRETKTHFFHLQGLDWLRAGAHSFWWNPDEVKFGGVLFHHDSSNQLVSRAWGTPEDYQLVGREVHRGRDCHVLALKRWSGIFLRRLYVGVEDRRVYGDVDSHSPLEDTKAIMRRITGEPVGDNPAADWEAWSKQRSPDERRTAEGRCLDELYKAGRTATESYFDAYREIAPGFFIPTKFGYTVFESDHGEPRASSRRDLEVKEAKVNQKLPAEMFVMEMREGVQVHDARHEPPLRYKFKKDFSPEEWQKVLDENRRDRDRVEKLRARMDRRIGERAVEFPATTWLNSKPMTWMDLKGQVVVLHFCANWCGPCKNDLPLMESAHRGRDRSGIAVIGIHTPTDSVDEVKTLVREFQLGYPICIDSKKSEGARSFGFLSSWYSVEGIPHALVVDRDGRVAGHGSLDQALEQAKKLAAGAAKD